MEYFLILRRGVPKAFANLRMSRPNAKRGANDWTAQGIYVPLFEDLDDAFGACEFKENPMGVAPVAVEEGPFWVVGDWRDMGAEDLTFCPINHAEAYGGKHDRIGGPSRTMAFQRYLDAAEYRDIYWPQYEVTGVQLRMGSGQYVREFETVSQ